VAANGAVVSPFYDYINPRLVHGQIFTGGSDSATRENGADIQTSWLG
jgi:hypothetical protein